MDGFLEEHAPPDPRIAARRKRIVLWSLIGLVVAVSLYFTFENWRQEKVVKQFFTLLVNKQYQDAYKLWGCTPETPCKYYPPEKFTEDWGPAGLYADAAHAEVGPVDSCGDGVVFTVAIPKVEPFGLEVERSNNSISFAPWPRCPGPHLHLWEFVKSRFGSN
jgi:hypothetical protein